MSQPPGKQSLSYILNEDSGGGASASEVPQLRPPTRPKQRTPATCATCGKVFGEARALRKHARAVHEQRKDHVCDVCGRAFAERSSLKKHAKALHGVGGEEVVCEFCDKSFKFTDSLRRHISDCHLDLRPYACPATFCQERFKQKTHLQKHFQRRHSQANGIGKFVTERAGAGASGGSGSGAGGSRAKPPQILEKRVGSSPVGSPRQGQRQSPHLRFPPPPPPPPPI